ncbi:MAG: L-rhamnose mutarotase [Bacteroidetes bacterium]|nr:MAG: L-rhamnose mutarotase [Bacteroidota bacterium]
MKRVAFRMKLNKGCEAEYERRHSEIWPELQNLLKQKSISEYSIFLDKETLFLFGYMKISDPKLMDELPAHPLMQKWWDYMKDIMETNADSSPVVKPLEEVFYLA